MSFTFGTDPEFMLKKGNSYVSAIPVVGVNNENPIKRKGHRFYWDNVLAECAVKPASSKKEAVDNIGECLQEYSDIVSPNKLVIQASKNYPKSALQDDGAMEAGCKADTCAYTMILMNGELSPAKEIERSPFRTCGGHIHLGHEIIMDDKSEQIFLIYLMDLFLGVPSLFIDKDPTSPKRRTIYGQAGRFRCKEEYGMEYRSLSAFWLSSPKLVNLVYDVSEFILESLINGQEIVDWDEDLFWDLLLEQGEPSGKAFFFKDLDKEQVKNCIDSSNKKEAKKLLGYIQGKMPKDLYSRIEKEMSETKSYNLYEEWSL